MSAKSPFVISSQWLADRLRIPGLSIVDGSWYLPAQQRDARAEYDAAHIPGAVFFDQDEIVEPGSDLPHTLPSESEFERHARRLGINNDDTIVVYDGPGMFSAPRVWWMFRAMGSSNVFVLDGGLDGWKSEGRTVTDQHTETMPSAYVARFDGARIASLDTMRKIVASGETQIADARPPGRFTAAEPEPRQGLRSGHMPNARNLPAASLSKDGYLLSLDELRTVIADAGIDLNAPVVTTCGSGVTAAVITLALQSVGHHDNRLYDGSWSEWGALGDTPVVHGTE